MRENLDREARPAEFSRRGKDARGSSEGTPSRARTGVVGLRRHFPTRYGPDLGSGESPPEAEGDTLGKSSCCAVGKTRGARCATETIAQDDRFNRGRGEIIMIG